jgi:hypothetical protein
MAKLDKADKKSVDNFETWSKQRAETVAQANRKITGRDLNLLMTSFNSRWLRGFSSNSSGFWLFNSRMGCYTFMPLFLGWGSGWGSPYGSTYSNSFYGGYNLSGRQLYGGSVVASPAGGANGGSGSAGGSASNPPSISSQPAPPSPAQDRSSPTRDEPIQRRIGRIDPH